MGDVEKNALDRNVLSSTHIAFLFGAGVNGSALPQLKAFNETIAEVERFGGDTTSGLESGIDDIACDISDDDKSRFSITREVAVI